MGFQGYGSLEIDPIRWKRRIREYGDPGFVEPGTQKFGPRIVRGGAGVAKPPGNKQPVVETPPAVVRKTPADVVSGKPGVNPAMAYWKEPVFGDVPRDRFSLMAGMVANALAPDTAIGRLGGQISQLAGTMYKERVDQERDDQRWNREVTRDDAVIDDNREYQDTLYKRSRQDKLSDYDRTRRDQLSDYEREREDRLADKSSDREFRIEREDEVYTRNREDRLADEETKFGRLKPYKDANKNYTEALTGQVGKDKGRASSKDNGYKVYQDSQKAWESGVEEFKQSDEYFNLPDSEKADAARKAGDRKAFEYTIGWENARARQSGQGNKWQRKHSKTTGKTYWKDNSKGGQIYDEYGYPVTVKKRPPKPKPLRGSARTVPTNPLF